MSSTEWLELESDPGLFTLLLEDFGVKGVQVEEIYDLSKPITETVYGFIFLFRWDNPKKKANRRSGRGSASSSTSLLTTSGTTGAAATTTTICTTNSTGSSSNATNDFSRIDRDGVTTRLRSVSGSTVNNNVGSAGELGRIIDPSLPTACPEPAELFFARQTVQNSCATHALLSILLNRPELDLGPMLSEFQKATRQLSPEAKGTAIGSMPQLAQAHNRHANQPVLASSQTTHSLNRSPRLEPSESTAATSAAALALTNTSSGTESISTVTSNSTTSSAPPATTTSTTTAVNTIQLDTFHFVCYVPFGGFLYELDGLKPDPINHGPLANPNSPSDWTRQCADILRERMQEQDVRYSLMAVVPDRRLALTKRMCTLDKNRQIIEDTLLRIARFEEVRKHGSADFRGKVADSDSPSSVMDHQSDARTTQSTESGPDDEKELTPSDPTCGGNLLPSVFGADDSISTESGNQNNTTNKTNIANRSIRTRSLTRANFAGEIVSPMDGNHSGDVISAPIVSRPSSPTASDVASLQARKRSPTSITSNQEDTDEAAAWVSGRKRRLVMTTTTDAPENCMPPNGELIETAGVAPNGQMNKMLASIVSVESPLLTTLTEMVNAAARVVQDTLDESAATAYRTDSPIMVDAGGSGWEHRDNDPGSLCTKLESERPSRSEHNTKVENQINSVEVNHQSFSSTYMSSKSSELTKPLTVDTQLWDRTRPVSERKLEPNIVNGAGVLSVVTDKSEEAVPNASREFRPQTRALTRARVKTESSSAVAVTSADHYSSTRDSVQQPGSSTSPITVDSPATATTTRSLPHSPSPDQDHQYPISVKREVTCESRPSHTLDDPLTTTCNESPNITGISSNDATSTTATATVASDSSVRRASKYPTRSSTKRDTLASHSLANCRTSAGTTTTTASATCSEPPGPQLSTITSPHNHLPTSLRPDLSNNSSGSAVVCFEPKLDPSEFKPDRELTNTTTLRSNNKKSYRPHVHIPRFTADELRLLLSRVKEQAKLCDNALLEEEEKRQTYRIDDARRVHNYEPFIRAYLTALAQHGLLHNLIIQAVQNSSTAFSGSSLLLLSPSVGAVGARKSSSTAGTDHSYRHDADRSSTSGSKGTTTDTIDQAVEITRFTSPCDVDATESYPTESSGGPTRRTLRARNKRNSTDLAIAAAPNDLENIKSSEVDEERNKDYTKPIISSPELRVADSLESTTTAVTIPQDGKVTVGAISDCLPHVDTGVEHVMNNGTLGPSTRSKPQSASPLLSNLARNGTLDASESSSNVQGPLSPMASSVAHTSYSSCGSAPQSPQSSTSSRSTYLRPPLRQTARSESAKSVVEDDDNDGFISRKSLRPRSSADRSSSRASQPGLSDSSDDHKPAAGGSGPRLLLRRRTYSSLVKHVDTGGPCKPDEPFSTAFSQRFRKRRLC